VNAVY